MKYKRTSVVLSILLAVAGCGTEAKTPKRPSEPRVVSFVHDIPQGHPRLPYFDDFAGTVDSRSRHEAVVRINPQQQVLAGRASLEAVLSGQANIAAVNMAHLEAIEPTTGFMNLPFGLDDTVMSDAATRDAIVGVLADQVRPHGIELLGLMRGADQLFAFPQNNIRQLEDLHGKRIRVAGGGLYEQLMRSLAAEPVPIPIPRLGAAMANGEVDGAFTSPGGWSTEIIGKAPHAVQVPGLMFINYAVVADAKWLAGLSAAEHTAVTEAGHNLTNRWTQMAGDDADLVSRMVSNRTGTYSIVPEAEVVRWRHRVADISARFLNDHPELATRLRQEGLFRR
ncbi:TRAP transporter substrate-binding protein [Nocardia nepalensis]|uniref:TRAP transporter substrate-binding protein n=1 Tax=Nocardia nepalensis TaxID=3375448 RepID=UPI003B67B3D4